MNAENIIDQAIEKALAHAKENGIPVGVACATKDDKLTFIYVRTEGDMAIVDTVDGEQKRALDQIFDVKLVDEFAIQIRRTGIVSMLKGQGWGVLVARI